MMIFVKALVFEGGKGLEILGLICGYTLGSVAGEVVGVSVGVTGGVTTLRGSTGS